MKTRILLYTAVVLMTTVLLTSGYIGLFGHKDTPQVNTTLNKDILSEVIVENGKIIVKQQGKADKSLSIPKSGKVTYRQTIEGEQKLLTPGWFPRLVVLPHLGISCRGIKVEPIVGVQLLRVEPVQLGISFNITPSNINVSLDKDLFNNSLVGIYYGMTNDGTNCLGFHFSLLF